MNQYIITEELLQEVLTNTVWGRTNQQKFRDKLHPYNPQAERDDPTYCVCGLTDKQCQEKNGWLQQEAREKMLNRAWSRMCDEKDTNHCLHISMVWKVLEELREGKGGEQG